MLSRPVLLPWLVAVWVGLWGDVTAANVLGGLAVAVVILLLLPLEETEQGRRASLPGIAVFLAVFAVELVKASWQVVVLVLRPSRELRSAVLRVPVQGEGARLLTLVGNAISLTPGTLTLEVDEATSTLYVHALDVGSGTDALDATRASIARLEKAAARALGQHAGGAR